MFLELHRTFGASLLMIFYIYNKGDIIIQILSE